MKHQHFSAALVTSVLLTGTLTAFPVSAEQIDKDGILFGLLENDCWSASVTDKALTEVCIPESIDGKPVIHLYLDTSEGAPAWEKITVPASITEININGALTNMQCYEVDAENLKFSSIDGVLFDKDVKTLLRYPCAKATDVYSIPESCEALGDFSFGWCNHLTEINFPVNIRTVGEYAFAGCTFETIALPVSVELVSSCAFAYNAALKKMTFSEHIMTGRSVFQGCTALETVTFTRPDPTFLADTPGMFGPNYCYDQTFADFSSSVTVYAPDAGLDMYREQLAEAVQTGIVHLKPMSEKPEAPRSEISGDANNDGKLSPADAYALTDHLCGGKPELTPEQADLDGDGKLNATDLTLLKRSMLTAID